MTTTAPWLSSTLGLVAPVGPLSLSAPPRAPSRSIGSVKMSSTPSSTGSSAALAGEQLDLDVAGRQAARHNAVERDLQPARRQPLAAAQRERDRLVGERGRIAHLADELRRAELRRLLADERLAERDHVRRRAGM